MLKTKTRRDKSKRRGREKSPTDKRGEGEAEWHDLGAFESPLSLILLDGVKGNKSDGERGIRREIG